MTPAAKGAELWSDSHLGFKSVLLGYLPISSECRLLLLLLLGLGYDFLPPPEKNAKVRSAMHQSRFMLRHPPSQR